MSLYEHVRHPWRDERHERGPVKVAEQHPTGNPVTRFNTRIALATTKAVGSMWCAYVFAGFDCLALPQAIAGGLFGIVQWVASFFLQLVLLSIIMVGQNVQADAADKRSEATYRDAETILHAADQIAEHLTAQDRHLLEQDDKLAGMVDQVTALALRLSVQLPEPGAPS